MFISIEVVVVFLVILLGLIVAVIWLKNRLRSSRQAQVGAEQESKIARKAYTAAEKRARAAKAAYEGERERLHLFKQEQRSKGK